MDAQRPSDFEIDHQLVPDELAPFKGEASRLGACGGWSPWRYNNSRLMPFALTEIDYMNRDVVALGKTAGV